MKIIDKTPFQDAAGNISISGRAQGTLKYGLNWFNELEAQKVVIAQLERALEKGFVLIRNFTLPIIEVVIPIILVGPGGIYVIHVTPLKGQFEAKGDQWNNINYGLSQPANINLIEIVLKRARAVQKYLATQNINLPSPVEAVLIASDPGAHIESLRPVARVVMSDAIKQFAGTLIQARPIWRSESVYDLADRIIEPRQPEKPKPAMSAPPPAPRPVSRAKAIFDAADSAKSFDPNEFDFAFEEGHPPFAPQTAPQSLRETNPSMQLPPKQAPTRGKILGLSNKQAILLVGMFIVECCVIVAGFGIVFYLNM
ncbi:MAG: NERD domain-containing protein [Chloroflexi bacterium]|nr:NERD domain-containing protein [Chloroflexota bacterium]